MRGRHRLEWIHYHGSRTAYETSMTPVIVDDTPLLGFNLTQGHLLLNLNLFDENNNLVLCIANNQLSYAVSPWDIQLVGRKLIVRDAPRQILVDMEFEPPNRVAIRRGRFLYNGVEILIYPEYVLVTNNLLRFGNNVAVDCPAGIIVGAYSGPLPCLIRVESVARPVEDRAAAIHWAKEAFP